MTDRDFYFFSALHILDKADRIYAKMERCGLVAEYDKLNAELERLLDGEFSKLQAEAAAKGIELREGTVLAWEKAQRSGK